MSDMRDKQPKHQTIDMLRQGGGRAAYEIDVIAWPYSGIKSEDVYARLTTFMVRAEDFKQACYIGEVLSTAIGAAHDIWVSKVVRVSETST